jgi:bacteriorhodopsin
MVWTWIVVCVPVLGACGWFVLGRERRRVPRG